MYKFNLFLKRAFDIFSSGFLALLLTPLWIVVAICIKKDSKGPIFFRQGRRTKNGRIFKMLKFRSMVVNAEKMGAGLFNYENDPRVTKVGRFLRNSSIDELPQLFNILKGDMSVVGPRPLATVYLNYYTKREHRRHCVRPGLTGWAQVNGRNSLQWEQKFAYDLEYIDNISLLFDIKIILLTVKKVFIREGIGQAEEAPESLHILRADWVDKNGCLKPEYEEE